MPFVFSNVEYCDMHFVYGFCNGNVRAAVEEYQRRFPDRRIPSRSVFTRIHQSLRDTGSLPSVSVQSERELEDVFFPFHIQVSQEECARLQEGVPYVKVYRYNPKHLCPKLNGYGDNSQRKVGGSCGSKYCNLHS